MSSLFRWAVEYDYISDTSCIGVKPPKLHNQDGFVAWNENDIDAYCKKWIIGTKERVWLDVLLYAGLRRGDAVQIGKQHIRDGVATIKTEKSGYKTEVTLPILPVLQETLEAGPTSDLAFIGGNHQVTFNQRIIWQSI